MYLIVDKASHTILHMSNAYPGEDKQPQDLLPGFDAATMDFGRSPESYIPARFVIESGVVRDLDAAVPLTAPPAMAAEPAAETLSQARVRKLQGFEAQALSQRATLIPDFQLLNAGLGLYDDARVQALRATVQAFRDEYHRLEAAVAKAASLKELDALQPAFPTGLLSRDVSGVFVAAAVPAAPTVPAKPSSRPTPTRRGGGVTE
jgi:hypothetical protein